MRTVDGVARIARTVYVNCTQLRSSNCWNMGSCLRVLIQNVGGTTGGIGL